MEKKLKALENRIGYEFRNRNLLILALTHSSYAKRRLGKAGCNERLEFLGDAVLELISSDLQVKFTRFQRAIDQEESQPGLRTQSCLLCKRFPGLPAVSALGKVRI